MEQEDLDTLYSLIPESILDTYKPKLADAVKINFLEDNFFADPGKYIKLWIKLGIKYPSVYINSFLENTYAYWYPDTVPDAYRGLQIAERRYEESSYFQFETEYPCTRVHLVPWLERFYEKVSLEIFQQRIPVLSMFFSMGFVHWCFAFLFFVLLRRNDKEKALCFSLIGFIYLTVLAGPVAIVRYVLYMFFSFPICIFVLLISKGKNE